EKAFNALGDSSRRELFEKLAKRPLSVGELAEGLPISRPAVSQHLKVLTGAGLVVCHKSGTRRVYQVDPKGIEALRKYLDRFWEHSLAAFKEFAEKEINK